VRRRDALLLAAAVLAGCRTSGAPPSLTGVTVAPQTSPDGSGPAESVTVSNGLPFPTARCAANREAGTLTYLSSYGFAAAASIVDVLVAEAKGYFRDLCLDVVVKSGTSTDNYPAIAANQAQFASGGSFGEVVDFAGRNDAGFVALSVEGHTGIDVLLTKPGAITSPAGVKGKTIGVKAALPPSIKAMLLENGLTEDLDYKTLKLEDFDPVTNLSVPDIVGFPASKSIEPRLLDDAGVKYDKWDPAQYEIPGSFGVIYTNRTFLDAHPTAAEDFMRATMRGLADALADPGAAAQVAIAKIDAAGNPTSLSPAGERARWEVESKLVGQLANASQPPGVPQDRLLAAEVQSYGTIGVFGGIEPDWTQYVDQHLVLDLYDGDRVVWPG
jgi:NitT/TauT family transport system substrate-binding protein